MIDGRQCNEWVLLTSTANLSLCATNDRPVELRYNLTYYPYIYGYAFGDDFHAGEQNASAFIVPSRCYNETICPGAPNSTEYISAYIFHPKNTTGMIENQDVADLLGDTAFICEGVAAGSSCFHITHY